MTFLDKYELLKKSIPIPAVAVGLYTQDCSYVDYVYFSKNCHYCFDGFWLVDGLYCNICWGNKLVDCHAVTQSQLCYECVDCNNCYSSTNLLNCNACKGCHFSAFLNSCSDCFGCVALTHKKYCIFNKQYTKDEYFKKVKEIKKEISSKETLDRMLELKKKIPHPPSQQFNNENCPYGDYLYNSKNCYWCFHTYFAEDSGYSFEAGIMSNCWDMYMAGGNASGDATTPKGKCERCYEAIDTDVSYNCAFLKGCSYCTNCFYSSDLRNCSDCYGCVGLTSKKYCILNNQLTKEQYQKAVAQIKQELGWRIN